MWLLLVEVYAARTGSSYKTYKINYKVLQSLSLRVFAADVVSCDARHACTLKVNKQPRADRRLSAAIAWPDTHITLYMEYALKIK